MKANEATDIPSISLNQEGASHAASSSSSNTYFVRMVTHLPGVNLGSFKPHSEGLLLQVGRAIGEMTRALDYGEGGGGNENNGGGFSSQLSAAGATANRSSWVWSLLSSSDVISSTLSKLDDFPLSLSEQMMIIIDRWKKVIEPKLGDLRSGVIHGDLNDYNLIVNYRWEGKKKGVYRVGIIDFGDMQW